MCRKVFSEKKKRKKKGQSKWSGGRERNVFARFLQKKRGEKKGKLDSARGGGRPSPSSKRGEGKKGGTQKTKKESSRRDHIEEKKKRGRAKEGRVFKPGGKRKGRKKKFTFSLRVAFKEVKRPKKKGKSGAKPKIKAGQKIRGKTWRGAGEKRRGVSRAGSSDEKRERRVFIDAAGRGTVLRVRRVMTWGKKKSGGIKPAKSSKNDHGRRGRETKLKREAQGKKLTKRTPGEGS